jgi:hypothetical protein
MFGLAGSEFGSKLAEKLLHGQSIIVTLQELTWKLAPPTSTGCLVRSFFFLVTQRFLGCFWNAQAIASLIFCFLFFLLVLSQIGLASAFGLVVSLKIVGIFHVLLYNGRCWWYDECYMRTLWLLTRPLLFLSCIPIVCLMAVRVTRMLEKKNTVRILGSAYSSKIEIKQSPFWASLAGPAK